MPRDDDTEMVYAEIQRHPGTTVPQMAAHLGMSAEDVAAALTSLEAVKRIARTRIGWHDIGPLRAEHA